MHCPTCQAILAERQKFCEECGTALAFAAASAAGSAGASNTTSFAGTFGSSTAGSAAPSAAASASGLRPSATASTPGINLAPGAAQQQAPLLQAIDAQLALVSDVGRQYPVNQDAGCVGRSPDGAVIMVVADGVSSADRAEVASNSASQAAFRFLQAHGGTNDAITLMRQAIGAAHEAVLAVPYSNKAREEPETTIVCARVAGRRATIGWVGDSRAYLLGPAGARILTRDDSWLLDTLDENRMSLAAALADRRSHAITQCLGMRDAEVDIHVCEAELQPGEQLLLCTDGLWNYFNDCASMAAAVQQASSTPEHATDAFAVCRQLVAMANAAGGRDNITVALYRGMA